MFSHLNNYILDESLGTEARTKKKTLRINYNFCEIKTFFFSSESDSLSCGHFTLHFITSNISSVCSSGQMMRNKRERKIISNSAIYQNFVSHRVNALYRIYPRWGSRLHCIVIKMIIDHKQLIWSSLTLRHVFVNLFELIKGILISLESAIKC